MKKLITLFLLLIPAMTYAQTKETREVGTFTKISFHVPGKLIVKQGSPQSVVLEGDKETLSKIETELDGDKLSIGLENKWRKFNWHDDNNKITAYVTVKDVEALSVSGSGDLVGDGKITANDLDLKVSGSGSLSVEVDAKKLDADVSGSGDIDVKGRCQSFESGLSGSGKINLAATISNKADVHVSGSGKVMLNGTANEIETHISGSGKVLAANLEVSKCDVHISGSGDVEINVKDSIEAQISGSGSVSYKGSPSHVNSHSSGSGHVRKL